MDLVWENPQLRQQMLNQLGNVTGICYQFYNFREKTFYFSDNLQELTQEIPYSGCPLHQWYQLIYEDDRARLQRSQELFLNIQELYHFNYRLRNSHGQLTWVTSKGKCTFDAAGRPLYFLGCLSAWKRHTPDETPNLQAPLRRKLRQLHSQGTEGYLLLVDVDNLSKINLKYGREFGDGILCELEEIMAQEDSRFSTPFRSSGSSFCTLATQMEKADVEHYFHSVQHKMRAQCTLSGGCVSLQEYQVPDSDLLIHYAENCLDSAQLAGTGQLCFFNPEGYQRKLAAMELQMDLENAVNEGFAGFSLHYQPQVRSETFALEGAEALLRFTNSRNRLVSPGEFVPILERTGLIVPVGQWVLRTALAQCRRWRQALPEFRVSVNMSYVQLRRPEIQAEVLSALQEAELPGSALQIEVTEGIELQKYTYLNTIFSAWKKEGVTISADDFGTGYSSLAWLKKLAIDEIKIDRCFVSGIQHSAYNLRLLSNIIELAKSGSLRVCCEGVETAEELAVLETLQPSLYQGFFFSRPLPAEDFDPQALGRLFRRKQPKPAPTELPAEIAFSAIEHAILEQTEDAISICDVNSYELYYLNPAAQKIYGLQNYKGRKCYQALRGRDAPCEFCPNTRLRHDSFLVWEDTSEYCDRHFLMRDKLLDINGRTLRFQVAMDITKHEYVSRRTQERLEFANRIVDNVGLLSRQPDWRRMAQTAMKTMGEFYQADRAYLFEATPEHPNCWDNTFEWCAPGVTPQKDALQRVSPEAVARWLEIFRTQKTVLLYNLEPLRKKNPLEWEILKRQGIQRVISVPLWAGSQLAGFIGVDNPRYAIQDDTHAKVLASFLMARFRRERKEWQDSAPQPAASPAQGDTPTGSA